VHLYTLKTDRYLQISLRGNLFLKYNTFRRFIINPVREQWRQRLWDLGGNLPELLFSLPAPIGLKATQSGLSLT
jgi:hypothetical protein